MQISDIPQKFNIPFANGAGGGFITYPLPEASQIGVTDGRASLTDGFPPLNFQPVGAGGVPPWGQDMNGALKQMSAWNRWNAAGGMAPYDATFATAIGGYPKWAVLASATTAQLWLNTLTNNTNNPDTGGAGWVPLQAASLLLDRQVVFQTPGSTSWVVPTGITQAFVEVVGAGGGGGGGGDGSAGGQVGNVGGGGGGGGYGFKLCTGLTPGASITVTVGAGGVEGNSGNSFAGQTGGTSSFGALISCTGGTGGVRGVFTDNFNGAGGTCTGGDLAMTGGRGGASGPNVLAYAVAQVLNNYAMGGMAGGGYSLVGWGAAGSTGLNGIGFGTGGGGGGGTSTVIGGTGAKGCVIVRF
jgi:hypothetical protein